MLIHGFSLGCTAQDLQKIITELFPDKKIQNLWIDPYREHRAVALFEKKLGI